MANQNPDLNVENEGEVGTNLQQAENGFVASSKLRESLQEVLVDFIDLSLVAKQAHWNIVGPNFRDLHLNLDEVVTIARTGSDDFAERMRALHAAPDGRPKEVAAHSNLPEFAAGEISTHDAIRLMVQSIEATVATMRRVHDGIDAEDPTSADVLHGYISQLEQQAWFLSAELRTPSGI